MDPRNQLPWERIDLAVMCKLLPERPTSTSMHFNPLPSTSKEDLEQTQDVDSTPDSTTPTMISTGTQMSKEDVYFSLAVPTVVPDWFDPEFDLMEAEFSRVEPWDLHVVLWRRVAKYKRRYVRSRRLAKRYYAEARACGNKEFHKDIP